MVTVPIFIVFAIAILCLVSIALILVQVGCGESTKVSRPRALEVATYRSPEYRITRDGNLWFGPTNPESTMHWAYLDGVDLEGKSVWVLARTEVPEASLPATKAEAEFIMRIAQDAGRR